MKAFIFISIITLFAGRAFSQSPKAKFDQAQLAYDAGKYAEALYYLDEAETALSGTNARIQSLKVLVYYDQGNTEKALEEVTKYFNVVPASMQGSEGYKNMLDLQKELKSTVENGFSQKQKKIEDDHQNDIANLDRELADKKEIFYYDLVKDSEYPQAIRDFIDKYPNNPYRKALEYKISKLNSAVDLQAHPEKYLIEAISSGNNSLVDKLLSYGCNVNVKSNQGTYAVHIAAVKGDLYNLKKLFYAGANINVTDDEGRTPLSVALGKENESIVDFLISCGADLDKADNNNEGPVFYAIHAYSTTSLQKLITYGANLATENNSGITPLVAAIQQNNTFKEIITALLYREKNINRKVNSNTPLYYAVNKDAYEIAEILLLYGADPGIKSADSKTMLYVTAMHKSTSTMSVLLKGKADPNQVSDYNCTPLHYTAWDHQESATALLLNYGALVDKQGPYGWTALHFASREQSEDLVKLLLANKANKKIRDEWGRTPKKIARERHFKNIKKLL